MSLAKRAAASVLSRDDLNQLATKTDIAELEARPHQMDGRPHYWLGRGVKLGQLGDLGKVRSLLAWWLGWGR